MSHQTQVSPQPPCGLFMCICGDQKRTSSVLFSHSLSYALGPGSLTEPGVRQMGSKLQDPSIFSPTVLGSHGYAQLFRQVLGV